jgi:hypothetical protein
LAFTVEPCNVNEKRCFQPLLEKLKPRGVSFKTILADAQYDSNKVREAVRKYGAEPIIPHRKSSRIRGALKVGYDFVVHGVKRLVRLFRKRVCIERVFSRAKEWPSPRRPKSQRAGTGFHTGVPELLSHAYRGPDGD